MNFKIEQILRELIFNRLTMRTTTFTSLKCGTALFAVILFIGCIQWISGETIYISYGTGSSQPKEGDSNYQLQCLITNLDSPAIAWSKDDNLLFWSTGSAITDLDMNGEYTIQEIYSDPTTNFILTFDEVRKDHSGNYKCFTATGNFSIFNVDQSSAVNITVLFRPGYIYFPSSDWPKCHPQNDIKALIYSKINMTCVSELGNPMVEINIYDPSNGQMVPNLNSIINIATNRIELIYIYQVIPTDNMDHFLCQIIDGNGMHRQCTMGTIETGLFRYDRVEVFQGADFALFQCIAGSSHSIHWSTDPPIEPSRLEMTGDSLFIHNVEMTDNGTKVICRIDGINLQDQIPLIVIPIDTSTISPMESSPYDIPPSSSLVSDKSASTASPFDSNIDLTPGSSPFVSSMSSLVSDKAASMTSPFDSTSTTFTTQNTTSGGLPIYVIAAIGGGGGLLLIALISCMIAICCCCRCRNRESDIKFEDGATTRISTGYMWDKELSHMVHESPRPSPKLTNNNHAHVRQALKDPDESDPSMSASLAYALANHSDNDLDSDDGDLKKPVTAAYETVDLNPAGRVLKHGASMHSNLYASTAIVAPNPPTSSNSSADFPPKYAVPDKNKYPSSRADDDATPTESPYAIVHPDPENPMVRASLRQRATEGHVNAAYDPNEEGFVENTIYEPAGR